MDTLEADVVIGMTGAETVQEATNVVYAALQALHGASSICFAYDCWNPAAMPGDQQYSINTAIDEFLSNRWDDGWYEGITRQDRAVIVTNVSRIAHFAWNTAYDAAMNNMSDGPLSQGRSPRIHFANMNIVYDAETLLNSVLDKLSTRMQPNDMVCIVSPLGNRLTVH